MGKQIWTKEKLKNEIIEYYKDNGKISQQDSIRLSSSAVNYFGSWGNALKESGIPLYNRYKKFYSKPSCIKQLVCKECNKFRIIESNLNWYYNMKDNPQRWEEYIKKRSNNVAKQI